MRTQRQQPRRQHGTKPDEPNKSNSTKTLKVSSTFSKVVGIQRAKPVVASAEAKYPKRILTNKAKQKEEKQNEKIKKRNAAKKVKPREVTKITILVKRLICIALFLYYQTKLPLFQICERSRANLENKANP